MSHGRVGVEFARHAEPGSDLDGAELAASELLTNAVRHAPKRPIGPRLLAGRALVVELARAVERRQGPDAVDAADADVAQVGASVGGRMEDEYRRARNIVGELSPAQIAELYVRLKAAIGGDF